MNQFGQPIVLFDFEDTKERVKGAEAYKVIRIYNKYIEIYLNIDKYFSSMWNCKFS
jgi:hypothetical protein